jgi:hypothetical protein
VGYLKQKEAASPCPLCAIYHEPNAETIAAMEEGDAMERGEIPANRFHSFSMESRTVTFHRAGTHADLFKS